MGGAWTFRKFIRSRLFLVAGSILAVFIGVGAGRELYANYSLQREIRSLEAESKKLESRRLELADLTKKLESGDFLDEQARLELGLQKPGETVVVVRSPENEGEQVADNRSRTNPELWRDYFLHRK